MSLGLLWPFGLASIAIAGVWLLGERGWRIDTAAQFAAQGALLSGAVALIALPTRRWFLAGAAAVGLAIGVAGVRQTPRAATGEPDPGAPPSARVMVYNAFSLNNDADAVLKVLRESDADVVLLTEPSGVVLDALRGADDLKARWPFFHLPDHARGGFRVLLSRWPQLGAARGGGFQRGAARTLEGNIHVAVIDRPEGAFAVVFMHPDSPRSEDSWRYGLSVMDQVSRVVNERLVPLGLPVVAGGDLNSTPSGERSRRFAQATGMGRAKPMLTPAGTWPAPAPWPIALAIDDVFVTPGTRVVSWRTLSPGGSDHRPVVVDLAFPLPTADSPFDIGKRPEQGFGHDGSTYDQGG